MTPEKKSAKIFYWIMVGFVLIICLSHQAGQQNSLSKIISAKGSHILLIGTVGIGLIFAALGMLPPAFQKRGSVRAAYFLLKSVIPIALFIYVILYFHP